mmetsp:Transcript_33738/g.96938  ORF Transcript_33738/g.96938 Transcript_33738/m.96938 type:complete len:239 (-) Transcript_33738:493-1209(-)
MTVLKGREAFQQRVEDVAVDLLSQIFAEVFLHLVLELVQRIPLLDAQEFHSAEEPRLQFRLKVMRGEKALRYVRPSPQHLRVLEECAALCQEGRQAHVVKNDLRNPQHRPEHELAACRWSRHAFAGDEHRHDPPLGEKVLLKEVDVLQVEAGLAHMRIETRDGPPETGERVHKQHREHGELKDAQGDRRLPVRYGQLVERVRDLDGPRHPQQPRESQQPDASPSSVRVAGGTATVEGV